MHTMIRNRISCLSLIAIPLCGVAASAGIIVLDDFDADPNDDALGERTSFGSSIIDDPFNQGGNAFIDTVFDSGGDTGALIMNSGVGVQQSAHIRYFPSSPLDLLSSGNTTFEFDFLEVDQDFTIRIVMIGGSGGKAVTSSLFVSAGSNQTVSVDIVNEFDFFSMDLSAVRSVELIFNNTHRNDDGDFVNTPSLDFVLSEFRAVPAPGALAFIGLSGLATLRRRRRVAHW